MCFRAWCCAFAIVRKLNVLAPYPTVSTRDLIHIAASNFQCDSSERNNRSRKQGPGVLVLFCDKLGTPGSWDRFESWLSQWLAVMALGELLNFSGPKFPQVSTGLDSRVPFSNTVLPFCGTGIAHGCPKDPLIAPGNRRRHWDPFGWWFQGSDLQGKWLRKAAGGNRKDLGLAGTQPITCLPVPFRPPTPTHPGVPLNVPILLSRLESLLLFLLSQAILCTATRIISVAVQIRSYHCLVLNCWLFIINSLCLSWHSRHSGSGPRVTFY